MHHEQSSLIYLLIHFVVYITAFIKSSVSSIFTLSILRSLIEFYPFDVNVIE